MLTQQEVNYMFDYKDGTLYWKNTTCRTTKVGDRAGTPDYKGYLRVWVKTKLYRNHHIIYLMHHGNLPKFIDHIDNDKTNNRIENLRECTLSENQHNRKINSNNTSGVKNVTWRYNRWVVRLSVNGKSKEIGRFEDLELAELVAIMAREKYHKQFARSV